MIIDLVTVELGVEEVMPRPVHVRNEVAIAASRTVPLVDGLDRITLRLN